MLITIYKITNSRTGKIYVGSTKENPEIRFKHHIEGIRYPDSIWSKGMKWYEEVKSDVDYLTLDILEQKDVLDAKDRNALETNWINKYANQIGFDKMYNISRYASVFSDPVFRSKSIIDWKQKYGDDYAKVFAKKRKETCIRRYGKEGSPRSVELSKSLYDELVDKNGYHPMNSKEAIEKRRIKLSYKLEYKGKIFNGTRELLRYLNEEEGSSVSYTSLRKIIAGKMVYKYKELYKSVQVLE